MALRAVHMSEKNECSSQCQFTMEIELLTLFAGRRGDKRLCPLKEEDQDEGSPSSVDRHPDRGQ